MNIVLFSSFLRMYAYLGEGECDVTAASHVLAMSHVAKVSHTIVIAIARAIAKAIAKAIVKAIARQLQTDKSGDFDKYI